MSGMDEGREWMTADEYFARPVRPSEPLAEISGVASAHTDKWEQDWGSNAESALRLALKLAWDDLRRAKDFAANGVWSIDCENKVWRIMGLTRIVGPTPWEEIPVDLLLNGWYERIHEAIGVEAPFTEDDRRKAQEVKDRRFSRVR